MNIIFKQSGKHEYCIIFKGDTIITSIPEFLFHKIRNFPTFSVVIGTEMEGDFHTYDCVPSFGTYIGILSTESMLIPIKTLLDVAAYGEGEFISLFK